MITGKILLINSPRSPAPRADQRVVRRNAFMFVIALSTSAWRRPDPGNRTTMWGDDYSLPTIGVIKKLVKVGLGLRQRGRTFRTFQPRRSGPWRCCPRTCSRPSQLWARWRRTGART